MKTIASFLETGKLARKQSYKNLTLFPLLAPEAAAPDYLTLEQALVQNLVQVLELDQLGSVPELRILNKGKNKVLIVEGEELVGAKQNRIVNATFLVAAGPETVIPVSCGKRYKAADSRQHPFYYYPENPVNPVKIMSVPICVCPRLKQALDAFGIA